MAAMDRAEGIWLWEPKARHTAAQGLLLVYKHGAGSEMEQLGVEHASLWDASSGAMED